MNELLNLCYSQYGKPNLKNTYIISAQHVLASIYELFIFLESCGLDLSKVFVIGKCYSSSSLISQKMQKLGICVSEDSFSFNSHESFDSQYSIYIESFIHRIAKKVDFNKCERIIVLDDGGTLISKIQRNPKFKRAKIVGIEQTSAGYNQLQSQNLLIPIINVARSKAKLTLESPHITNSFLRKLSEYVSCDELFDYKILILGKGAIGTSLFYELNEFSVDIYDPKITDKERLLPLINSADIIIGCSGHTSLPYKLHKHLKKDVLLASLSSSDREFDAQYIRKKFPRNSDPWLCYYSKNLTLLQSGFPLNFWGTPHNIPLEHISITLALLASAIFYAGTKESMDLIFNDLDYSNENELMTLYSNLTNASPIKHTIAH
ncbi:MAG: hypothetical protein KDK71_04975 [Chlamydiia bacterium]|nr:hypothetical protein [Chlamydiia bacterium]